MNLTKFRQTWAGAIADRNVFRTIALVLVGVCAVLAMGLFSKEKVVVLVPPTLNETVELSSKTASMGFKKSWGLYLAGLIGNVKPGTADLIVSEIQTLMRPDVLAAFRGALAQQLETIRRDQLSVDFEASQLYYEKETDKVFVLGKSIITGPMGKSGKFNRVFEMEFDIRNYAPVVTFLDTYEGDPHTLAWKEKEARKLERAAERGIKPEEANNGAKG